MTPLLTILCTAYNQEQYIREALESFVKQKTTFPFEVIVHDDASTDKTPEIIREYAAKYPEIIKPIFQTENQFQQGKDIYINFLLDKVQGKYVCINEGDDYFTDENKLQRQVDFLESHPDFAICFHPVKVIWEDKSQKDSIFPTPKQRFNKDILTLNDLLKRNFIQTNSAVYRWCLTKETWPEKQVLPCDYLWHLIHAKQGKIGLLPEIMSAYRKNAGGIWTGYRKTDIWYLKCGVQHLRFLQAMETNFNLNKQDVVIDIGKNLINCLLRQQKWLELEALAREFPILWEKIVPQTNSSAENYKIKKLKKKNRFLLILTIALLLTILYLIGRA